MAYTYFIGWSKQKKYYYGVRYSKKCNPKELWITYFTSSKHVKKHREIFGEPDIVEIRKLFDDVKSARTWETKVLTRLMVKDRVDFLNKTNNLSISLEAAEEGRKKIDYVKMGQALKRFYKTADPEYIKQIKKNRYDGILRMDKASIEKLAEARRKYQLESWSNPDTKEKRSATMRKPKSKSQCPHCNKIGGSGIMQRWHFDNCKFLNLEVIGV